MTTKKLWIGTSGWSYDDWKESFHAAAAGSSPTTC